MMKAPEDGRRYDAAHVLDDSRARKKFRTCDLATHSHSLFGFDAIFSNEFRSRCWFAFARWRDPAQFGTEHDL
jgi:hypothetical protein